MSWSRIVTAGVLAFVQALACGGTTRNGGGSAGEAGTGGSSPGPGPGKGDPCAAMDARSDGTECGGIPGYTWLGELCEPILCGCTGADCDELYPSMEACDRAHDGCYAQSGLTRSCTKHADCALALRDCCGGCGEAQADQLLALHVDSTTLREAGVCRNPSEACPDCVSTLNPTHYPACIDGVCSVVDVGEQAGCQSGLDCQIVSKDCCDCGGDFTLQGVMAVGPSYQKPARCDGVGCDGCLPGPPEEVFAMCDRAHGACVLYSYELL